MKLLTALFILIALPLFGANPDYRSFRGAGGITIVSNPPTGTIVIDGSGMVASGTNSSIGASTNGTAISGMASNINFTAGNNAVLKGTNIGSTAHLNIGVASNLTFNSSLGSLVLGTWDGKFGFSNSTLGEMSFWLEEPDTGNEWAVGGVIQATNITLTAIPGTGTNVGITAGGTLFRTTVTGGSSVAAPLSSVQFNSNGVMQGSAGFVFTNSNVGIGTTAPTNTLDVQGHASIRTNLYLPGLPTNASPVAFLAVDSGGQVFETAVTSGGSGMSILASNFFAMGISNIVSANTAGIVIRTNAGSLTISNSGSGFSVSGNSNQIPFLNVAGTGFLFGSTDKSAPGFGFQRNANGGSGGALLIHADVNEDIGLVQIGLPTPGSSISAFVPSLSITNRYSGDGQTTQEMVRVNYVDIDGGSSAESFIQTWRSWVSGVPPASTLVSYAAALRKDGRLTLANGLNAGGALMLNGVYNPNADRMQVFNGSGSLAFYISSNAFLGINVAVPAYPIDINVAGESFVKISTSSGNSGAGIIINNTADAANSWALVRTDDGRLILYHSDGIYPAGTVTFPIIISTTDDITMSGTLSAGIAEVIGAASATLTAQNCRGTTINNFGQTVANTQTLPTASVGLNGIVHVSATGVGAFNLKAGPNDKIYLNGVALDDGDKATLSAPLVGDWFSFTAFKTGASAYDWIVTSGVGTLSDGGP